MLVGGLEYIKNVSEVIDCLCMVPFESWEALIELDPEYKYFKKFKTKLTCGQFSVLLLMAGLNAYQLKGYAEKAYWSKLSEYISKFETPSTPTDLSELLVGFYGSERLPKGKLKRITRFLGSDLAKRLWKQDGKTIEKGFEQIGKDLAKVMNQKSFDKTICFSMKCLAISLSLYGYADFNFSMPIPVDSRILRWTNRLGLCDGENKVEIQQVWNKILQGLKDHDSRLNMIHLDCLLWQTAVLENEELICFFNKCGGTKVAEFFANKK